MRAWVLLFGFVTGCAAIGDIEAPVLRADDSGPTIAPESDSSEAGIHAEGDAGDSGVTGEEASSNPEAAAPDSGFDAAACTYHWSFCAGECEPQLSPTTPEACYCVPTCACIEALDDFSSLCLTVSPDFTTWSCVDRPLGAEVTCLTADGGIQ